MLEPQEETQPSSDRLSGGEWERLFPGDSEMAGRMRALDWSTSDLGPPESWPENLRVAVRLCLTSRFSDPALVGTQAGRTVQRRVHPIPG